MRRDTAIGRLFRTDEAAAREELERVLVRCEGNIVHAAHELGMGRRQLYRLIYRAELWPVVNAERQRRLMRRRAPEWLTRTREALRL